MITIEQAKALHRTMVIHDEVSRPCSSPQGPFKWRVNGRVQFWVRSPERFRIPVKHGLYEYGQITEGASPMLHLEQDCTAPDQQVTGSYRNHAVGCDRPYEHPGGCLPIGV